MIDLSNMESGCAGMPIWLLLGGVIPFFTGAALFSFADVVAWRWPRGLSLVRGRSVCPACGTPLRAAELVPVLSWLALRGHCRHCGARIPARHPLGELLGGLAALGAVYRFGAGPVLGFAPEALLAVLACALLYAIACLDAATREIPDALNLALAVLGLARTLLALPARGAAVLLAHGVGALCVSAPMLLLCLAVPGAFGGGDIKLMAAAGLWLGWPETPVAFLLAVLGGGGYGLWLLATRRARRRDTIAFGPFLCAGIAAALFAGDGLIGWYLSLL